MVRNARRSRVLLVVVIALVGLNIVPIDECDDYAFFHPRTASAEAPADGPSDFNQHVCSCLVCDMTTNDSFAPRVQAPQRGEAVGAIYAVLCSSAYLPGIFRPPIV